MPNSFGEILFQKLETRNIWTHKRFVAHRKELKITETAQNNKRFQLLNLVGTYEDVF